MCFHLYFTLLPTASSNLHNTTTPLIPLRQKIAPFLSAPIFLVWSQGFCIQLLFQSAISPSRCPTLVSGLTYLPSQSLAHFLFIVQFCLRSSGISHVFPVFYYSLPRLSFGRLLPDSYFINFHSTWGLGTGYIKHAFLPVSSLSGRLSEP